MRILLSLTVGFALSAAASAQPDSLPNWEIPHTLLPYTGHEQGGHGYLGHVVPPGDEYPAFITNWSHDTTVTMWRQSAPFQFYPDTLEGLPDLPLGAKRCAKLEGGESWYFFNTGAGRYFRKDDIFSDEPAVEVFDFGGPMGDFQVIKNGDHLEFIGFRDVLMRWQMEDGVVVGEADTLFSLQYHSGSIVADLNYDTYPDILTSGQYPKYFMSDGQGGWGEGSFPDGADRIALGDFNNDNHMDVVSTMYGLTHWGLKLNELLGQFSPSTSWLEYGILWAGGPMVADINFDGLDDVVFRKHASPNTVVWRQGIDDILTPLAFDTSVGWDLIDFDNDGDMDSFSVFYSGITVWENTQIKHGCTYSEAANYNASANVDDGSCFYIDVMCPGDQDGDDFVSLSDLLMILSAFGSGCP